MYLIEEISSENLNDFQNQLNKMQEKGFRIIQIFYYKKGNFQTAHEAIVLFEKYSFLDNFFNFFKVFFIF